MMIKMIEKHREKLEIFSIGEFVPTVSVKTFMYSKCQV